MKNLLLLMAFATLIFSCAPRVEKPAVSINHYSQQVFQITEVVNKLMTESNVNVMHDMADGVEETRAIGCDAVGEECNAYYGFLNRVVTLSNDGAISPADRAELEKMRDQLRVELKKSDAKIQKEWKDYINADKRN
ncbi:MAG: hypothetical protein H7336_09310 [Bacteriovorax sp.]|nr:hypothetical protein [Bacteriovorax sp.]